MYNISAGSSDIVDTIEDSDVFNSSAIFLSDMARKSRAQITKYEGRLDLLTEGIYGNSLHYGLLGLVNRIGSTKLSIGDQIKYIPDSEISKIYLGK